VLENNANHPNVATSTAHLGDPFSTSVEHSLVNCLATDIPNTRAVTFHKSIFSQISGRSKRVMVMKRLNLWEDTKLEGSVDDVDSNEDAFVLNPNEEAFCLTPSVHCGSSLHKWISRLMAW